MAVKAITQRAPGYQVLAPITHLSKDITWLVLFRLPGNQVSRLGVTCKYFNYVMRNDSENLWKRLCQQDFPRRLLPSNTPSTLHYQHCFKTEQNWRKGQYVYKRIASGGTWQRILSINENKLLCNSSVNSLQLFNLKHILPTPVFELSSSCDDEGMDCLEDNELIIVSISPGNTTCRLEVWDKSNGTSLWHSEQDCVDKVVAPIGIILLTEQGSCIKVWDRKTHQARTLISNVGGSKFLKLDGSLLYTGTPSGILKCWDKDKGISVRQYGSGQEGNIRKVFIDNSLLICLYHNGTIHTWKKEDGSLVYKIAVPDRRITRITIDEDVILATCESDRKNYIACWNKAHGTFYFEIEIKALDLYLKDNRFIFVSFEKDILPLGALGNIEIRDKYTGTLIKSFSAGVKKKLIHAMYLAIQIIHVDNRRIFSLINLNTLKIWDIYTGDLLFVLDKVRTCKVIDDRLVVVYEDGNIDICDFSSSPEIPFPHKGQLPAPPKP